MERLTRRRQDNGRYYLSGINEVSNIYPKGYGRIQVGFAVDKLGKFEGLQEQGRLLELPCAVGDTVYVKMMSGKYAESEVRDFTHFISCGFCAVVTSEEFGKQFIPFSEFGKTAFLKKEETEKALEGKTE